MKDRFDETASKTDVVIKQARRDMDEAFRAICDVVEAHVVIEGLGRYQRFIKMLNVIIDKYNIMIHAIRGSNKRKAAKVAKAKEKSVAEESED